jgi:hypothetical protein
MAECITENEIGADTLEGATQIANFLNKTVRQAQHLLETRQLPAFKLGNIWHMRKSKYRAHIERLEAEAAADRRRTTGQQPQAAA